MSHTAIFQKELTQALERFEHALTYKKNPNDPILAEILVDAQIRGLQKSVEAIIKLFNAYIEERHEVQTESFEQFLTVATEKKMLAEEEKDALCELIEVCQFISEAQEEDQEQVAEILKYLPMYHKAIAVFGLKIRNMTEAN